MQEAGEDLNKHYHGTLYLFECPICEVSFTKKSALNNHIHSVHYKQKPDISDIPEVEGKAVGILLYDEELFKIMNDNATR